MQPGASADIDGRVIAHVLDDVSDQPHALVEGVDGVVYYLPHDAAISAARANGKLKPNSFTEFRSMESNEGYARTVEDLGDADQLLSNRPYLRRTVRRLVQQGILDDQSQGWSGWLGRYQAAINSEREAPSPERPKQREMSR